MEDPTPPLDTLEVFGGLKAWLFEGPKHIGSLWVPELRAVFTLWEDSLVVNKKIGRFVGPSFLAHPTRSEVSVWVVWTMKKSSSRGAAERRRHNCR